MTRAWLVVLVVVSVGAAQAAPKTESEKARAKAEKKLESFTKEYDPSKKLARKGAELDKDIADLDKELDALTALDAAAGAELKGKRDAAVEAAKRAVGGAAASKASEDFEKKLAKAQKDFDPEKKNLLAVEPRVIEKAKKELDDLIAALDPSERPAAQTKRDELFSSLEKGQGDAKSTQLRKGLTAPAPVAPIAGVEAIAPMKPTWCDGVLESYGKRLDSMRPPVPTVFQGRRVEGVLFSCLDPDFDARQQLVAAYRQSMSNLLNLTAAQNEKVMQLSARVLVADNEKKDLDKQVCDAVKPVEGDAAQRGNRSLERQALSCGNERSEGNLMRLIDIDTPTGLTSQLAMAGLINRVLPSEPPQSDELRLFYASDIAVLNTLPLDPAAFERQLAPLSLNVVGELRARLAYFGARAQVMAYVAAFKGLSGKVPGLTKAVFDAPAAAVKKQPDAKVLDLVLSMEAQPGPIKGCATKLWPFFVAELKPQANAKLEEVRVSGLLAWALAECAARDPDAPAMAPVFNAFAERTTAVRGPLTAAYLAYVEAYNDAAPAGASGGFDESRKGGRPASGPLALGKPRSNPIGEVPLSPSVFGQANTMNPSQQSGGGVVKTVENKGSSVRLTFKTETFKVPDYSCVETNRIDRINPDGTIVYRQSCTKVGEHEETSTIEPVEVPAFAAAGVAVGSFVVPYGMASNSQAQGRAFIIEAYDSKARGKRTSLLGVAP